MSGFGKMNGQPGCKTAFAACSGDGKTGNMAGGTGTEKIHDPGKKLLHDNYSSAEHSLFNPWGKAPKVAGEMDKRADNRRYGNSEEAEYQRKGVGEDGGSRKVEKIPTEKCRNWRG